MEEDFLGRFNACSSSRGVDCSLHLGLPGTQPSSSSQPQVMSPDVCSMCGTTKTPLWRSGPYGPKSLCNACGIRYRKEQRRLALSLGIPSTASTRSSSTTQP